MVRFRIAGLILDSTVNATDIVRLIEDSVLRNRFPPKRLYNERVISVSHSSASRASSTLQRRVILQTENYTIQLHRRTWSIIRVKPSVQPPAALRNLRKERKRHVKLDMVAY